MRSTRLLVPDALRHPPLPSESVWILGEVLDRRSLRGETGKRVRPRCRRARELRRSILGLTPHRAEWRSPLGREFARGAKAVSLVAPLVARAGRIEIVLESAARLLVVTPVIRQLTGRHAGSATKVGVPRRSPMPSSSAPAAEAASSSPSSACARANSSRGGDPFNRRGPSDPAQGAFRHIRRPRRRRVEGKCSQPD
jgi:hypothetical protein